MHDQGVLTSVNSDSNDLARRLNTEAAKSMKYSGLSAEEALKLVTINPAKQLRVDSKVGSLEVGKDADFVIWSGNPLSNYASVNQTWIDGRKYFDRAEDAAAQKNFAAQRDILIQKAINERIKDLGKKDSDEKKGAIEKDAKPPPGDLEREHELVGVYSHGAARYKCTREHE